MNPEHSEESLAVKNPSLGFQSAKVKI